MGKSLKELYGSPEPVRVIGDASWGRERQSPMISTANNDQKALCRYPTGDHHLVAMPTTYPTPSKVAWKCHCRTLQVGVFRKGESWGTNSCLSQPVKAKWRGESDHSQKKGKGLVLEDHRQTIDRTMAVNRLI